MKREYSFWRLVAGSLVMIFLVAASLAEPAHGANGRSEASIAGLQESQATHILVFSEGSDIEATAADLVREHGLTVVRVYRHALPGLAAVVPPDRLAALAGDDRLAYLEANQVLSLNEQVVPSGVQRITGGPDTASSAGDAGERIDIGIAIIDTGIQLDHPDLNVYQWTDCTQRNPTNKGCRDGDPGADDGNGHGTHVAGTAAALDNGIGIVGVAPGAPLGGESPERYRRGLDG